MRLPLYFIKNRIRGHPEESVLRERPSWRWPGKADSLELLGGKSRNLQSPRTTRRPPRKQSQRDPLSSNRPLTGPALARSRLVGKAFSSGIQSLLLIFCADQNSGLAFRMTHHGAEANRAVSSVCSKNEFGVRSGDQGAHRLAHPLLPLVLNLGKETFSGTGERKAELGRLRGTADQELDRWCRTPRPALQSGPDPGSARAVLPTIQALSASWPGSLVGRPWVGTPGRGSGGASKPRWGNK